MNWFVISIIAGICFSGMLLIYKKLLLLGINSIILNLFVFGFVFLGFTIFTATTKTQISITPLMILLLIGASLFSLAGNYAMVKAFDKAPNPGYVSSINISLQLTLITILSIFLYNSEFSLLKLIGIIIVLVGIYIIGM